MQELTHLDPREMHDMAHKFRDLVFDLPFQIPADLIFLGRCVAILSGICTGLHPEFNLFKGIAPFAQSLLADEGGDWIKTALDWLVREGRRLGSLPARLDAALGELERGELVVAARPSPELEAQIASLRRGLQRVAAAVICAGFLVSGTLLSGQDEVGLAFAGWAVAAVAFGFMLRG
jgi:predicted unusual protein kinase regulating ubiquinone biosynthesis (AarF/ABC1/UbiB family)